MAERPSAYVQKQPGDIIRSGDWNELQVRCREELQTHTHKGGADGTLIPRDGLAPNAVDGSRIDPGSTVGMKSLTLSGDLRAGNVAIGLATPSPDYRLDVDGPVNLRGNLGFGRRTAQMLNLWGSDYGVGVQAGTAYFRTAKNFAWFTGGTHNDGELNPGGGTLGMVLQNGRLGIGAVPAVDFTLDVNGAVRLGGFTIADAGEWPRLVWCRDLANSWDEGLIKHSSEHSFFGRTGFGIHIHESRDFSIMSTGWSPLLGVQGGTGNVSLRGSLTVGNSDLYFSRTDHDHTGIGNQAGWAAIENARNYDALMIMGRAGTAKGRCVKLWDYLQVNGPLDVTGAVTATGLRINFGPGYWVFQVDGNLVKYRNNGQAVWSSGAGW